MASLSSSECAAIYLAEFLDGGRGRRAHHAGLRPRIPRAMHRALDREGPPLILGLELPADKHDGVDGTSSWTEGIGSCCSAFPPDVAGLQELLAELLLST